MAASVLNTFAEFLVALLPIPIVVRLSMGRQQRRIVTGILVLGVAVAVMGSFRTYYVWVMEAETFDLPWWGVQHWIFGMLEVHLALIGACAPAMHPLLSRVHASLISRPAVRRLMKMLHMKVSPLDSDTTANGPGLPTSVGKVRMKTNASEKYRVMYTSHASAVMYQTVDFDNEGFGDFDDPGYGHSVSVTGPVLAKKKGGLRRPLRRARRKGDSDDTDMPAAHKELEEVVVATLDIVERRSLDIRSSCHESILEQAAARGWPPRDTSPKDPDISTACSSPADHPRRASSGTTAVDDPPVPLPPPPPPRALLRDGGTTAPLPTPARSQRASGMSSHSWWEYSFMPLSPGDRTMWPYAFESVYSGDSPRSSWRP